MNSFSFVVLNEYVDITIEDLEDLELTIIENESDLELGYFTVTGNPENISRYRNFLNGEYNM